jgi:hypothetical protein
MSKFKHKTRMSKFHTGYTAEGYPTQVTTPKAPAPVRYKTITDGVKGKLVITPEFKAIVDYLHKEVGNTEWIGFMYYEMTGTYGKDVVITPKVLQVMNIGSHSYVAKDSPAALNAKLEKYMGIDPFDDEPSILDTLYKGLIHTHHTMATFFSDTDNGELWDNFEHYLYGYCSLIVNMAGSYTAKTAILEEITYNVPEVTKMERRYDYLTGAFTTAEKSQKLEPEKVCKQYEFNVVFETVKLEIPEYVKLTLADIKTALEEGKKTKYTNLYTHYDDLENAYKHYDQYFVETKPKKAEKYSFAELQTKIGLITVYYMFNNFIPNVNARVSDYIIKNAPSIIRADFERIASNPLNNFYNGIIASTNYINTNHKELFMPYQIINSVESYLKTLRVAYAMDAKYAKDFIALNESFNSIKKTLEEKIEADARG